MSAAEDLAAKHLGLPPVGELLNELAKLDEVARRRRIHEVIRMLAGASQEMQQAYRDAITSARHIGRQDWKSALSEAKKASGADRLRRLPGGHAPSDGMPSGPGGLEPGLADQLAIDITDEAEAVREITQAIRDGAIPSVYVRGHQLVHVVSDKDGIVTSDIDHDLLRSLMADHYLACVRKVGAQEREVGTLPYPATCKAILARVRWRGVPVLRGVVSYPVMLGDGAILQQAGYHAASGLFLHAGMDMEPVPAEPSTEDVAAAKKFLLEEYLTDFPWVSDADKANYLAILMTPLLREIIAGLFPFADLTAPERGSGKTLLGLFLQVLYGASTRTLPKDDAEMRKSITASLRGPCPVIIFDNIPEYSTINSPSLAAVLTLPAWSDRILGQSREGTWPNDRLWCATGTNIRLGGDFAQRSVLVRIDYGRPRPDLRAGFKIEDIDRATVAGGRQGVSQLLPGRGIVQDLPGRLGLGAVVPAQYGEEVAPGFGVVIMGGDLVPVFQEPGDLVMTEDAAEDLRPSGEPAHRMRGPGRPGQVPAAGQHQERADDGSLVLRGAALILRMSVTLILGTFWLWKTPPGGPGGAG